MLDEPFGNFGSKCSEGGAIVVCAMMCMVLEKFVGSSLVNVVRLCTFAAKMIISIM